MNRLTDTPTLKRRMIDLLRGYLDPAVMERNELGDLGPIAILQWASEHASEAHRALSAMLVEGWVGQPDGGARMALIERSGLTWEEIQGKADDGTLQAYMAERQIDLAALTWTPLTRRDEVDDAISQPAPWEVLDSGLLDGHTLESWLAVDRSTDAALRLVQGWVHGKTLPIVTLSGAPGRGKTHLLQAAGQELDALGEHVLYRTEGDLFGQITRGIGERRMESVYQAFATVPWLIWDDLGREAHTDWGMRLLDRLVDDRYRYKLNTLIATNLDSAALAERLPRAASRLRDKAVVRAIRIVGRDMRERS